MQKKKYVVKQDINSKKQVNNVKLTQNNFYLNKENTKIFEKIGNIVYNIKDGALFQSYFLL